MNILDENKYKEIWESLDKLSPAAGFIVTVIHMGKIFGESGDKGIFKEQNISIDEFETLFIINNLEDCRPKDITDNSVMQPAKITRVVDNLNAKKMISRLPVKGDRRSYNLSITEKGKKCLQAAEEAFVEKSSPMIKKMGRPAVIGLNMALRKILINLEDK